MAYNFPKIEELHFAALCSTDAPFVHELVNSEGWLNYIGDRNVKTLRDAIHFIEKISFSENQNPPLGFLKVCNSQQQAIGIVGMVLRDYLEHPDIGFAFIERFTGSGVATKSCFCFLNWYLDLFEIKPPIKAIVQSNNDKCIRLLEKLNFLFVEDKLVDNELLKIFEFQKFKTKLFG